MFNSVVNLFRCGGKAKLKVRFECCSISDITKVDRQCTSRIA